MFYVPRLEARLRDEWMQTIFNNCDCEGFVHIIKRTNRPNPINQFIAWKVSFVSVPQCPNVFYAALQQKEKHFVKPLLRCIEGNLQS